MLTKIDPIPLTPTRRPSTLAGTVRTEGSGRAGRIQIHDLRGRLVRILEAAADGSWSAVVPPGRYLVISRDLNAAHPSYNAQAVDYVRAVEG